MKPMKCKDSIQTPHTQRPEARFEALALEVQYKAAVETTETPGFTKEHLLFVAAFVYSGLVHIVGSLHLDYILPYTEICLNEILHALFLEREGQCCQSISTKTTRLNFLIIMTLHCWVLKHKQFHTLGLKSLREWCVVLLN